MIWHFALFASSPGLGVILLEMHRKEVGGDGGLEEEERTAFSFDEFGPYLDNKLQLEFCQEGYLKFLDSARKIIMKNWCCLNYWGLTGLAGVASAKVWESNKTFQNIKY